MMMPIGYKNTSLSCLEHPIGRAGQSEVVTVRNLCNIWSFVSCERPILDDEPKPHKFVCSARLPSSITEAQKWLSNNGRSGHQCVQTLPLSTRLTARPIWDKEPKQFTPNITKSLSGTRLKNKDFHMKSAGFHMKITSFHVKIAVFFFQNERPTCKEL